MKPQRLFRLIDLTAKYVPEPCARALFSVIGSIVGCSSIAGVKQLRRNYQRVSPSSSVLAQHRRSATAMRHYLRYYYEAFRLPYLTEDQIRARVRVENVDRLRDMLNEGSATGALMHMGNWDLAGAWGTKNLAPVHTVAEKLKPEEVAQTFLDLRRALGMVIYYAVKDEHVVDNLTRDMTSNNCFVPLLCDRDLSASGIEVSLCGHKARIAPGPAILAQRTETAMFPVICVAERFNRDRQRVAQAGTSWGIRIIIGDAITPQAKPSDSWEKRTADVQRMMSQWAQYVSMLLPRYLSHWHMLQRVFVDDLDPQRLPSSVMEEK
ncbi:phosphatidylinositol mannoside acyltransferase [Arcanobacterium phocae]|uniref:KDO2-lipid IV(A) lauroyltransferase n=1 Tax=Arcanobacterium phocae TaxID=131112 RepID=A0A1H2LK85_9ACTO|nr:phosphatidylinositol mannoside acyltransferase [Arcanobacterium phocae]SDU81214.1 KDO2-lipid IV(A) lauroyltransferase [Arcanobacterium phocae]